MAILVKNISHNAVCYKYSIAHYAKIIVQTVSKIMSWRQ